MEGFNVVLSFVLLLFFLGLQFGEEQSLSAERERERAAMTLLGNV